MGHVWSKVKVLRIAVKQVLALSASYEKVQKRIEADPGLPVRNPTSSFWHDVLSPIASYRPESLPQYVDVVVIGSGITGTSAAHTLLKEGGADVKVLMLEARQACSGATGRNGGHVKPPLQHEYTILKKRLGEKQAAKIIRLRLAHLTEMLAVAKEERILETSQVRSVDTLDVYWSAEMFEDAKEDLEVWKQDMPKESRDHEWVAGEEASERFGLSARIAGAVYNTAGAAHPYRFVTGILENLLRDHSKNFILSTNTPCTAIHTSGSHPLYIVETPHGTVKARHIIHATNAWVSHLLPKMRTKVFAVRGNMTAQRPGGDLSPRSLDGGRSWVFYDGHIGYDYLTQLPNGEKELMFGGGFVQGGKEGLGEIGTTDDSEVNEGIVSHLAGCLPFLFGERNWGMETAPDSESEGHGWAEGRVKAHWSGIIGISADQLPWVGRIPATLTERRPLSPSPKLASIMGFNPEKERLGMTRDAMTAEPGEWIAAGYSGEGMAHAFLCGRAVALQVLDYAKEIQPWFPECLTITEKRWEKARYEDLLEAVWG